MYKNIANGEVISSTGILFTDINDAIVILPLVTERKITFIKAISTKFTYLCAYSRIFFSFMHFPNKKFYI